MFASETLSVKQLIVVSLSFTPNLLVCISLFKLFLGLLLVRNYMLIHLDNHQIHK